MEALEEISTPSVERLIDSMNRRGTVACVGLDPVLERLPAAVEASDPAERLRRFSLEIIESVADTVACIKVQSACFERLGAAGSAIIDELLIAASDRDLPVILDAKRGDVGVSAAHYAHAAFVRSRPPGWITVNGYLGMETLEPYLMHGGVFVLVRTSNAGSGEFQTLRLQDGRTVSEGMADLVASLAASRRGPSGWSDVGAVVGATHPDEAAVLRNRMPGVIFLVPGIGAQGGRVEDCQPLCGEDGHGAVLTASRSVIYAEPTAGDSWQSAVKAAAMQLAEQTGNVAGLR